jgi:hypothetical protein
MRKNMKPWYARVIWNDSEGGILSEIKCKTKKEAEMVKKGFDEAKTLLADWEADYLDDYFVDVTQNDKLIED